LDEKEPEYLADLKEFFLKLSSNNHETQQTSTNDTMRELWGFNLEVKKSSIKNGGNGVFVKGGCIEKYSLAAMYPGMNINNLSMYTKRN